MSQRRTGLDSPSTQGDDYTSDKHAAMLSHSREETADRGDWFRAPRLLYSHQIPQWQHDNEYILGGYRPTSESTWLSVASLSYLHNQTINAYSHLIGALIFVSLPYYFYDSPKFRHWRACFYAGFGLSSIIFVVHGLVLHGWELQRSRMSLVWMGWMATSNLVGAAIYATRVPERWAPYRFDLCGASHQLFHIFIIAAAVIHFDGLVVAFRIIRSNPGPCHAF
ncbi:Hly-III related protein [Apiospora hydei]|uniref:Hly-III related protein n=1 Tax=Apiospora hydei TaxID=1337664 RepID=A0ABR1WRF4_9PEZI